MTRELNFVEAMNEALTLEMARDDSIVIFGENIRGQGRGELRGLQGTHGDDRVIDLPISEAAMTGIATGAALAGARPIIHYQVSSLIFPAFDQLVDQAAKLPLMLGGQAHVAATYLIMGAGASGGRAGQHSDNPYPYLIHAGIKTVLPSTPSDAKGLLATAIREDDPVAFFVPVRLTAMRGPVAEKQYVIPLAQGEVKRQGRDVTVVAMGHLVGEAIASAEVLSQDGIDVEVWDPRSLLPLDRAGLAATVHKTGRVVLFDDTHRSCGYAAELSSIIAENCFRDLKAPIKRVTRADVTIPFGEAIEAEVLPDRRRLERAIRTVMAWE
ncbi:MAG: alpha-ketoacid dehydrogenase subunit beta [Alphaproteobacteria bacterium]|nr:alpha-ketoacid dehydrogenase subunit beta [Alphaproteobacteria bacterium]